jgi:OHCU decarboxylase
MDRLSELNRADDERALALIEPLIERAPQIAERVARRRPFDSTDSLSEAIRDELVKLSEAERVTLFRAHPELAPDNPLAMTQASQSEQGRLNLTSNGNEYRTRLADLNARYRDRHGFPFITALVRHDNIDSVLEEFEARLNSNRDEELKRAIEQVAIVSSSRVLAAFGAGSTSAVTAMPASG